MNSNDFIVGGLAGSKVIYRDKTPILTGQAPGYTIPVDISSLNLSSSKIYFGIELINGLSAMSSSGYTIGGAVFEFRESGAVSGVSDYMDIVLPVGTSSTAIMVSDYVYWAIIEPMQ